MAVTSAGPHANAPRSRQTTTPVSHHSVFTRRMPFLPPNQHRQSTEGIAPRINPDRRNRTRAESAAAHTTCDTGQLLDLRTHYEHSNHAAAARQQRRSLACHFTQRTCPAASDNPSSDSKCASTCTALRTHRNHNRLLQHGSAVVRCRSGAVCSTRDRKILIYRPERTR